MSVNHPDAEPKPKRTRPAVDHLSGRILVDADECAHLLGMRRGRFAELRRGGLIPRPVVLAPAGTPVGPRTPVRWRLAEILDWVAAGCPPAAEWRWTPTVRVRIVDAIASLTEQRDWLAEEIRELEARREAGAVFTRTRT